MNVVKLEHHLKSLRQKHESIDREIKEQHFYREDETRLKELKLKKLRIKEEIEQITQKIA